MKSAASCSNSRLFYPTLWKKNILRFWPIWTVYLVCWLIAMPLNLMQQSGMSYGIFMSDARYFADLEVLQMAAYGSVNAAFVFGILSAMAVFSYLYNNRSVGFFHALPVRREGLFFTNYLSGLSFMLLPTAAIYVLTILAELAKGCLNLGALSMWLAMQVLLTLFFYSFAVFCAMFTGHILALPAFYGILSALPMALVALLNAVLETFVYGFNYIEGLNELSTWLTPVVQLSRKLNVEHIRTEDGSEFVDVVFHGLGYGLIYALVGLVLIGLALLLYRKRHLEGAGDVVTIPWVRSIFKYGVAFCSALALGLALYSFFSYSLPEGAWTLLCFMVLCGAVGYFAAEMLLKKSFRVIGESWKGCIVFSLCLVALVAGMELDITGFERRVPSAQQVVSAQIDGINSAPYDSGRLTPLYAEDPALIEAVLRLHQQIVDERALHDNSNYGSNYESKAVADVGKLSVQTTGNTTVSISYQMAGGGTVIRRYRLYVTAETLRDGSSAPGLLTTLINRPDVVMASYFQPKTETYRLTNISLDLLAPEINTYNTYPVPAECREELVAAIKSDIEAGRLGRGYLLDDEERLVNCYYNDLEFEYVSDDDTYHIRITPQITSTETLACLREAGVLTDTRLLETHAQMENRDYPKG